MRRRRGNPDADIAKKGSQVDIAAILNRCPCPRTGIRVSPHLVVMSIVVPSATTKPEMPPIFATVPETTGRVR